MNVQFSKKDLSQWAKFSGDYNSIHFDEKIAKEVGLGGIAVHGMLAMLPLKSGYDYLPQPNEGMGRQWHVNLRNPVPLDACYCVKTNKHERRRMAQRDFHQSFFCLFRAC
ncbi:MaoC/PaaZ C-terminal domain-containing protein [Photorhabdus stackebrandtii]|uniref:MaoC/PaaZ C-terminal domain-containing protein n=1 Tax=Photorhabdus stackebrandtii TaxID=1123042 RepID=UPI001F60E5C3|nr:MaoC/PaaZ C-terminal domain-containing protein [Photorhabdus stackebrandtii]